MSAAALPHQPSFADLGTALHAVTFVVVDLETTGGSPHQHRITEFGAVKIRGGEILGEFQSLVDPGQPIPAAISALTGITDGMVAQRPPVEAVLPTFLEFCRGTALVAHNAGFDTGFLNAALQRLAYPRLTNPVLCTAALARRLVRDEVRNCKLATLAQFFACRTVPVHRALADAQATVEVFHGLLERGGSFGVMTLEDLIGFSRASSAPVFASRRKLADGLPSSPGVYAFVSASGEVLYVGKATDLRTRVRSYFGSDERRRIAAMVRETQRIDHRVCPTPIEAAAREVRLIGRHRPRFNRRSKNPERGVYVRLTKERYPRLSIVRTPPADGSAWIGPLPTRSTAEHLCEAIHDAVPIRRCTMRITARTDVAPCVLAPMGRCLSPCDRSVSPDDYATAVAAVSAVFAGDATAVTDRLLRRMAQLSATGRFEEAGVVRDRLRTVAGATERARIAAMMGAAGRIVASRPLRGGGHEVAVIADGRLVASARADDADLTSTAGCVAAAAATSADHTLPAAGAEEAVLLGRWLHGDHVVIHHCDGVLTSAIAGGRELATLTARLARARRSTGRVASELAAKRRRREPQQLPTASAS